MGSGYCDRCLAQSGIASTYSGWDVVQVVAQWFGMYGRRSGSAARVFFLVVAVAVMHGVLYPLPRGGLCHNLAPSVRRRMCRKGLGCAVFCGACCCTGLLGSFAFPIVMYASLCEAVRMCEWVAHARLYMFTRALCLPTSHSSCLGGRCRMCDPLAVIVRSSMGPAALQRLVWASSNRHGPIRQAGRRRCYCGSALGRLWRPPWSCAMFPSS